MSIRAHQTIGVETVLSTPKYRRLVSLAKKLQFELNLIYVLLDTPERNVERVRLRVAKGGHNVPKAKILERYDRSLRQLPWFLQQADRAYIFDNSGSEPRQIGEKKGGVLVLDPSVLPPIVTVAQRIRDR